MMDFTTNLDSNLLSTLQAMRNQEESGGYQSQDYLYESSCCMGPQNNNDIDMMLPIDEECREKMVEWCFQIVNFCKFRKEIVEITFSYLDRFLSTTNKNKDARLCLQDRRAFQLATMTCLYTAIKIHEAEAITPQVMSRLSRFAYQPHEFEACEMSILTALTWKVNPPTAMSFYRHYIQLLEQQQQNKIFSKHELKYIEELVQFQIQQSLLDYEFVTQNKSTIAFCALSNALYALQQQQQHYGYNEQQSFQDISIIIAKAAGIDATSPLVTNARTTLLHEMQQQHEECSTLLGTLTQTYNHHQVSAPSSKQFKRSGSIHISPKCVTGATQ